jgi:hypothetical protein
VAGTDEEGSHASDALDPSFDDDLVITAPDAALAPDVHDDIDDDSVDEAGDEDGFDDDASGLRLGRRAADLAGAALLGAAIGAGLGLLAHRATQGTARPARRLPAAVRRRQVELDEMLHDEDSRPRRLAARAEADVQSRLAGLADTVGDAVRSLADLRDSMERTVGRELRALQRAARRRR